MHCELQYMPLFHGIMMKITYSQYGGFVFSHIMHYYQYYYYILYNVENDKNFVIKRCE